jgi:hypothetical protein
MRPTCQPRLSLAGSACQGAPFSNPPTDTNKWLLISESRDDPNRCTPCREKSDTRDTYAFHVSPRTPRIYFLCTVHIRDNKLYQFTGPINTSMWSVRSILARGANSNSIQIIPIFNRTKKDIPKLKKIWNKIWFWKIWRREQLAP